MLLHDMFIRNVGRFPEKIAVKATEGTLSYKQLYQRAQQIAQFLVRHGLKKGDRVVLYMDNSLDVCSGIYGVLMAGGVFVLVNPTTKYAKLRFILRDSGARFMLTQSQRSVDWRNIFSDVHSLLGVLVDIRNGYSDQRLHLLSELYLAPLSEAPLPEIIDVDLAALIYTSGSNGNPKGVMMTHHNMVSAGESIITYLENTPSDIVLNALPLSFDYGLYQLLMCMTFGGTLILEKDFVYPAAIVQQIIKEKVTGFPGVPTVFALLFKWVALRNYDFSTLRYITNTGAALPEEFIRELRSSFPKARIFSMYGLTECKRVAFLPPEEIDCKPNSVGQAMPNCEAYILGENNQPVAPGEIGELMVHGSNVMQGYWNLPEETAKVLVRGNHPYEKVLRTGDLFRMDEEGYLCFVARKDDIIKSRGEKVSPKEIENVLYQLKGIEEAAVIGVADEILGQAIKAFIKLAASAELRERDVIRHCSQRMENYYVPKYIEFVSELPKSENGKIDKKKLIAQETANA